MLDTDPDFIDKIAITGPQRGLFGLDYLESLREDTSSNFYKGTYDCNQWLSSFETFRLMVERCDNFSGLNIIHSVSGGTGSGVTCRFLENFARDYRKKTKLTFTLHPSMKGTGEDTIVAPYNACHAMANLKETSDLTVLFQNQALYELCRSALRVEQPNFLNINRMIA